MNFFNRYIGKNNGFPPPGISERPPSCTRTNQTASNKAGRRAVAVGNARKRKISHAPHVGGGTESGKHLREETISARDNIPMKRQAIRKDTMWKRYNSMAMDAISVQGTNPDAIPAPKPVADHQEKEWETVAETPETHIEVVIVDQRERQEGQHPSLRADSPQGISDRQREQDDISAYEHFFRNEERKKGNQACKDAVPQPVRPHHLCLGRNIPETRGIPGGSTSG